MMFVPNVFTSFYINDWSVTSSVTEGFTKSGTRQSGSRPSKRLSVVNLDRLIEDKTVPE